MAIQPQRKLGYDDYVGFPNDGLRWEVIDGEAYMVPSPTTGHQDIVLRLATQVRNHLDEAGGGRVFVAPLDVILSEHDIVQPDVVFVADADAHLITDKNIQGVPTWVVEVVSDPVRDRKVKRDLYMRYEVGEYWALDAELRRLEIYRPGRDVRVVDAPATVSPQALPAMVVDLDPILGKAGPRRL